MNKNAKKRLFIIGFVLIIFLAFVINHGTIDKSTIKLLKDENYMSELRGIDSVEYKLVNKENLTKEFTYLDKKIKISNKNETLIELKLISNYEVKVIPGEDIKVAEFYLFKWKDDSKLFDSIDFYDIKEDYKKLDVEFNLKYKNKKGNWVKFDNLNDLPNKNITIGLFTNTTFGEKVEWIPTISGFEIFEFASWDVTAGSSFEFAPLTITTYNSLVKVNDTRFLNAYSSGNGGFVILLDVDDTTINIPYPAFEYDTYSSTVVGKHNSLIKINDTHFLNVYSGKDRDGYAIIIMVNPNGTITKGDNFEFSTSNAYYNSLAKINDTHYLNVYIKESFLGIYAIVLEVLDNTTIIQYGSELNFASGDYSAYNSLIKINDTRFINVYSYDNNEGQVTLLNWDGVTLTNLTTTQFTGDYAYYEGSTIKINDTHFINTRRGESGDSFASVLYMNDNLSFSSGTPFEFDTANGGYNSLVKISDYAYINVYAEGSSKDGNAVVLKVNNDATITQIGSTLQFEDYTAIYNSLVEITTGYYLNTYQGYQEDGYAIVLSVDVPVTTCGTLGSANTIYELINNISNLTHTCITISANNITLNGNGYTITHGGTTGDEGIRSIGNDDLTVKNLTINNSDSAETNTNSLTIKGDNILIQDINITNYGNGGTSGILIYGGNNIIVEDIIVNMTHSTGAGRGIYLFADVNSNNITIKDSSIWTIQSSASGIELDDATFIVDNLTLSNIDLHDDASSSTNGIHMRMDRNEANYNWNFTGITIDNFGDYGFQWDSFNNKGSNIPITNTNISNSATQDFYLFDGKAILLNVTATKILTGVSADEFIEQWYIDVYVNDNGLNPVENANVTAYNSSGIAQLSVLSNANGIVREGVTYYLNSSGTTTYYGNDNMTINVTKVGHDGNLTENLNLSGNIDITSTIYGTNSPTITLDLPTNISYLNSSENINISFTPTDLTGLDTCQLYGDWGGWHLNQTWTSMTSGNQISTLKNISDGTYLWNVWCNDTSGLGDFSSGGNLTFIVDTTYPVLTIVNISTTAGSQNVGIQLTSYTEINCNASFYTIYNSTGSIENSLENMTFSSCGASDTFTVTAYADYNYTLYMNDLAGNENSKSGTFTVSSAPIVPPPGGGGGSFDTIINYEPSKNISIVSENRNNVLDISLAKDSVKPRSKTFLIINKGIIEQELTLACEEDNSTTNGINICDYVFFPNETIIVYPNEQNPKRVLVQVYTPENSSIGEEYFFNIMGTTKEGTTIKFSKLSVSNKVTFLGQVRKWSLIPALKETPVGDRKAYPVWSLSLIVAFITFVSLLTILSKKDMPVSGFFLGILISFIIFFSGIAIL